MVGGYGESTNIHGYCMNIDLMIYMQTYICIIETHKTEKKETR